MIWVTVSSKSCFYWLYRASQSLVAKNIINLISVLTMWWWACVESSLGLLKHVFAMTSVFSWKHSVSLCPASFCTPWPNFSVWPCIYSMYLLTSYFCIPIPYDEKDIFFFSFFFFLLLVLEGGVCLQRTGQLQFLQFQWLGHRLGLLWC